MSNSESLTYEANHQDYEIKVTYYNDTIEVSVDGWGEAYRIELELPLIRRNPKFTRFIDPIRKRIHRGIFVCLQIHEMRRQAGALND